MNNVEQIAREARLKLNNEVVTLDNDQYEIASNIITEAITAAIAPLQAEINFRTHPAQANVRARDARH